jgi:hypothetical protein
LGADDIGGKKPDRARALNCPARSMFLHALRGLRPEQRFLRTLRQNLLAASW